MSQKNENSGAKRPTLKAVRGTRDLLPDQTALWNRVEATARAVFARYGFGEIRTPIFEDTSLFSRAVGEETDIVSKEMFSWEDGERFNEPKMVIAWIEANKDLVHIQGQEVSFPKSDHLKKLDLIAFRKAENVLEFVEFKPKPTIEALAVLRETIAHAIKFEEKYRNFRIIPRLVVPAGSGRLPVGYELRPGEKIEEFPGNFFQSSQQLSLRPENTASVVRAYIEHQLGETGALQKLYYIAPQFRRERPQKGRYRQFWQIGAEVLGPPTSGSESALRDAEVLEMLSSLLNELGIRDWRLDLNSVGNAEDRARYNAALRDALAPVKDKMSPDNQRRAETNPLRVLDSKDEADQAIIDGLPRIADYLGEDSKAHFAAVLAALDACGVQYNLNPRLVRGLDYYTRTTFEFTVTTGLGTQNALLGGGRYDGLSEMLGGPRAPGIGFAIGEDRLILTLQAQAEADAAANGSAPVASKMDAYIAPIGTAQNPAALALAHDLRSAGLAVEVGDGSFKLGKSFGAADKLARHVVLVGEDEVATNVFTVKTFATGEQVKTAKDALVEALKL